jgi:hypothetical protein
MVRTRNRPGSPNLPVATAVLLLPGLAVALRRKPPGPAATPIYSSSTGRLEQVVRHQRRRQGRHTRVYGRPPAAGIEIDRDNDGRTDRWEFSADAPAERVRPKTPDGHAEIERVEEAALAQLPESVTLDVVGYHTRGYDGYANLLRDTAARLGVSARVVVADAMPRAALLAAAAGADVGVALLPALSDRINERAMVGASNKPFDYMAAGLTLLVPDAPAWRHTFVDAGFGLACDPESAVSIAGAVQCLLSRRTALAEMGRRGQEQIARDWNYELTFAPVMTTLLGRGHDASARGAA